MKNQKDQIVDALTALPAIWGAIRDIRQELEGLKTCLKEVEEIQRKQGRDFETWFRDLKISPEE